MRAPAALTTSARQAPRARQGGFTLTEVLVTAAVVGLSLSLAVPSLKEAARSNLRAAAVNELVATLHTARSEALTRNRTVAVCPSADGETCSRLPWDAGWIRFADDNGNFRADAGEAILGSAVPAGGVEIRTAAFAGAVAFGPAGRVSAPDLGPTGGDFLFCGTGGDPAPRVIVLSVLGQPQLTGQRLDGRPADCSPG
jgi:type IV fimbrial biogenesis protein FimT